MSEDVVTDLITGFFNGGWRVAPFVKTPDGYIGVKAWPKRAACNAGDLQLLINEQRERTSRQILLGIVPNKGQYVIDIDTKKNAQALQIWRDKVFEAYGDAALGLPDLIVKTKSGGFHLYYSDGSDKQIHSPTSIFSKDSGIDIRGYTGMVIAPTSIGTIEDWQPGEYTVIKGQPSDKLTVLGLSKIIGDSYDEGDQLIALMLSQLNEVLRNDQVSEFQRYKLIPDSLIVPSSSRDNTLYKVARLCRLAGLSQDAALVFISHVAQRCEATPEEPIEHWLKLAGDKVRRVYASATEMQMQTISAFYQELDNAGTVLLRGVSKAYFHFRHGSHMLRLQPRSTVAIDNLANAFQGLSIKSDEGEIAVKKVLGAYYPKAVAWNTAMCPKPDLPFFEFEGQRYVNTYSDPFAAFEPNPELLERARPFIEKFEQFVAHITGYEPGDAKLLLDKLAWLVQKPYRRMPTGTIIYSHTRGSGKDVFMGLVREIVGRTYYMPITLQSIENSHTMLHDKIVCCASEVQLQVNARGNQAAASFMGVLKDKVTQKTTYVNEKFMSGYIAPIYAHFFLLSNYELSSILEPGDRRFDVFHAAEQKFDQEQFGELADITNDGIWIERGQVENSFRAHVIYALRTALANRPVDVHMDRHEATMNDVKKALMETQNPPTLDWLWKNLPPYFTEDIAMMACHFCPVKAKPEYVMRQLREHFGPELKSLYRAAKVAHRLNGAPKLTMVSQGGIVVPTLDFNIKTADSSSRKMVYYFNNKMRPENPTDGTLKIMMKQWYEKAIAAYYGHVTTLPNQQDDKASDPT